MRGVPATLVVVAVFAATLVAAPPAWAAQCPAAGGDPIARSATKTADFVVVGGGFGHGVGMSQYGARGAALLGCTRSQILSTYYPGTTMATSLPSGAKGIRVSLAPSAAGQSLPSTVDVTAVSNRIAWKFKGVTKRQPAGTTWRVTVADGRYAVHAGATRVFAPARGPLRVVLNGKVVRLPLKDRRYNRGTLVFTPTSTGTQTFVTNVIANMDRYLYGLAEMPSSWPRAALASQAIAGRTYALQRRLSRSTTSAKWAACRCDVYDSVSDQVYSAYEWESLAPRWIEAVDATSGRTLQSDGAPITAFYHSSSGGHTESSAFVFGGTLSYAQPVDDSRWERASGNPNTAWEQTFSGAELGKAFGMGTIVSATTPQPTGASGRIGDPRRGAGGVVLKDKSGKTKRVAGPDFRMTLKLPSALFAIVSR